tara:strand:- start:1941 stop:2519 length:579 start_codon:yes stop_codon:yes gene_type:complete
MTTPHFSLLTEDDVRILNARKELYGTWDIPKTGVHRAEFKRLVERACMPHHIAHLSFPRPINGERAKKELYRFFRKKVCSPGKQHVHLWSWSGIQPNRVVNAEHFHLGITYGRQVFHPDAIALLWMDWVKGTKESALVEEYDPQQNAIAYFSDHHPEWDEYFVCSGGQHRCRNGRDCWWNKNPDALQTFNAK